MTSLIRSVRDLPGDVAYAVRSLRKSPTYTVGVVLILAVVIGANTAVFSLVDGVLLRPLAYAAADRIYTIQEAKAVSDVRFASYPTFLDWRSQTSAFDAMAYVKARVVNLRVAEGSEQLVAAYVSPQLFALLGQRPHLGRVFGSDAGGAGRVAVLSDGLWHRRFGGNAAVVGQPITLSGETFTVIGVMPRGFAFPDYAGLWIPLDALPAPDRANLNRRDVHVDSDVLGRLAPGMTLTLARRELNAVAARIAAAYPGEAKDWQEVRLTSLTERVLGTDVRGKFVALGVAVCLVLLIGCANLATLSLIRADARTRELAIRYAVGATDWHLARYLLLETLLPAIAGGALGLVIAQVTLDGFRAIAAGGVPRLDDVGIDGTIVVFTLGLSLLTGLAIGSIPAWRTSRVATASALATRGARLTGRHDQRLRFAFVVGEVALTLAVLSGAGLLVRSQWRLETVDLGFDPSHLLTIALAPPQSTYDSPSRVLSLYGRILSTLGGMPGVQDAALVNEIPIGGGDVTTPILPDGRSAPTGEQDEVGYFSASSTYFRVIGARVMQGRDFTEADVAGRTSTLIVNETLAQRYWPGQSPIGHRATIYHITQGTPDRTRPIDGEIVGVVHDMKHFGAAQPAQPEVYLPYTLDEGRARYLVLRTRASPASLIPALQRALGAIDPNIPSLGNGIWTGFIPMRLYITQDIATSALTSDMLAFFALSALLLACIGLYGVVSASIVQRRRELAMRLALGAAPNQLIGLVLRRAVAILALGLTLGAVAVTIETPLFRGLLFGVTADDPSTYAAVAATLAVVGFLAAIIPALRTLTVQPIEVLGHE